MIHCTSKVDSLDSRWFICWMYLFASNVSNVSMCLLDLVALDVVFFRKFDPYDFEDDSSKFSDWKQGSTTTSTEFKEDFLSSTIGLSSTEATQRCNSIGGPLRLLCLVHPRGVWLWLVGVEMLWSKWIHSSFWLPPWMFSILVSEKGSSVKGSQKGLSNCQASWQFKRTTCLHFGALSWSFCGNSRRFRCCFMWNGRLPPQSRNVELLVMIPLVFHLGLFFWVEKTDQKK